MTINRLSIVNDALAETGNNTIEEEDDGSDEWDVASRGYNNHLPILLEAHPWKFATTTETLDADDSPSPDRYPYAYSMPARSLFLVDVTLGGQRIDYAIIGNLICCSVNSTELLGLFVQIPSNAAVTNSFFGVLRKRVEASCLRGLNEDYNEARMRDREADAMLLAEQSRVDRQQPRQEARRSRMLERRRGGRGSDPSCRYRQ